MSSLFSLLSKLFNITKIDTSNFTCTDEFGVWNTQPNELYVIGDIHGDFYALKQALELTNCVQFNEPQLSNIINWNDKKLLLTDGCIYYENNIKWNPNKKNCMIVFSGDLIDRCRNINSVTGCITTVNDEDCDFEILKLLFYLDNEALKYNSRVVIVLGNHEIMNLKEYTKYFSKKALNNHNRLDNIKQIIHDNINKIYGLIRINNYIIVHGGINELFFTQKNSEWETKYKDTESIIVFNKIFRNNILENNFELSEGDINPFWDRSLGRGNDCNNIFDDNILKIKDLSIFKKLQIIVAHCPQFINDPAQNINSISCNNNDGYHKIWRIDVGMSRAFDKYNEMEILNNLQKLNNFIDTKNNPPNPLLFYHNNIKHREVSVLKIQNKNEQPINGISSLNYFYKNVFHQNKEINYHYLFYYLLQDLEIYLKDLYPYENINEYIDNINQINNYYFRLYINKILIIIHKFTFVYL
jgi:hypothetical protein